MPAFRPAPVAISLVLAAVALPALVSPAAAADKRPPACAAVNFRPVSGSPNDGTMDAGMYKSRFGRIVLRAEISGNQAKNYYVEVNGQRPPALSGAVPAAANGCLNSKHVKTPAPSAGDACTGERFRVVVATLPKQKLIMLYGLQGDTWKQCSAGTVPAHG